jgi:hypothetical protein
MNEITNKKNFFNKVQSIFKLNFKLITGSIMLIVILFAAIQYYLYYKNNEILKASIVYEKIKANQDKEKSNQIFDDIIKENNFYGLLANLENIQIKLNNNEIDSAYIDYVNILNRDNLNKLYKSLIAIQGSYNLLDKIEIQELKRTDELFSSTHIYKKINTLLSFFDDSIDVLMGHKLEISFLLLVIEQNYNTDSALDFDTTDIFEKIQKNNKISSVIKERVQKIYDFQLYK